MVDTVRLLDSGVVAGSQIVGPQRKGLIEEKTELYVLVAGDAGIWGSPLHIFLAEVVNYILLELILQVDEVKRYTESQADLLSVVNTLGGIARAVLLP